MPVKIVHIKITDNDLDVELSNPKIEKDFKEGSVRPIATYMIWVQIDASQIGFYL